MNSAKRAEQAFLLAFVLLCAGGCKGLQRFWTAELTGAVFLRMGSGETRPQGGIEVRLAAPEVRKEIDTLQATFQRRVKERQQITAALEATETALREELRKWQEETAAKIEIRILSARPDLRSGWLHLDLSVLNNTQFRLTTVMYELVCGDRRIPTIGDNSMLLLTGADRRFLEPGKTHRTPSWGETFYLAEAIRYSDDAKALLTCPLKTLRAKSVGFGVFDSESALHSAFDLHRFASTPTIDNLRRSIQDSQGRLAAIDAAGVSDLDVAVEKALQQHAKYSTRTDVDGRYRLEGIKPASYILAAFYESAVDNTGWFVSIDVSSKMAQDLSNFNLSDPRFAQRWKAVVEAKG